MEQPKILIVEDNDVLRRDMKNSLYGNDITVFESSYKTVFQTYVSKEDIDLILLGSFCSADSHVLHIAKRIRELDRLIPLIMITENSSEEHIITALRAGINDYFKYPFKKEELLQSIERCLSNNDTKKSLSFYKKMPQKSGSTQNLIGASRAMQSVSMLADHASVTDCNVLITGETGTGKELVANLIHRNSSRGNNPFVCINCHTGPSVGK